MRGGDDDAAVGTAHTDCQFGGGGGGVADINNVAAAAHKGAADYILHHFTGDTTVATYDDFTAMTGLARHKGGVSSGELHDV